MQKGRIQKENVNLWLGKSKFVLKVTKSFTNVAKIIEICNENCQELLNTDKVPKNFWKNNFLLEKTKNISKIVLFKFISVKSSGKMFSI